MYDMDSQGSGSMAAGDTGFHIPLFSAVSFPNVNFSLAEILDEVDDLLFMIDLDGWAQSIKARNGSGLGYFRPTQLAIKDLIPPRVRQKFLHAFEKVSSGGRFAMFDTMIPLPEKGAAWFEFRLLPTADRQMALFIWNITKYKELSGTISNVPFSIDKMTEGWSRALYLRDYETEDHTRRVTEMTLGLAKRLDVSEQELAHIRRGAELHDIGKIAIPDDILFKAGALTEDEWQVMRQHPMVAVELLGLIPHIHPALEIPRSHHEKWDGSGYPEKIAEKDIPLSARIFAFADVYDALTSDRPYRRAWSRADALDYICKQSGAQFDPSIVPVFINMLSNIRD